MGWGDTLKTEIEQWFLRLNRILNNSRISKIYVTQSPHFPDKVDALNFEKSAMHAISPTPGKGSGRKIIKNTFVSYLNSSRRGCPKA